MKTENPIMKTENTIMKTENPIMKNPAVYKVSSASTHH